MNLRAWVAFLIPFLAVLAMLVPVAGARHLWQDEIETAERARSVLTYGVPRVISPDGQWSLNAGGFEVEEGTLHRYTPWLQFYWAALFGAGSDVAVRLPFILAHAAAAGLIGVALVDVASWPLWASIIVSFAFAFNTPFLLWDRSARYPALLALLYVTGLLGLGRRSWWMVSLAVVLLPQAHTMGGGVLAGSLVIMSLLLNRRQWQPLVAAFVSVLVLLVLTRPWAHGFWGRFDPVRMWSLQMVHEDSYGFFILLPMLALLLVLRKWKLFAQNFVTAAFLIGFVCLLDFAPLSNSRYYIDLPLFCLLWFIPFGTGGLSRWILIPATVLGFASTEYIGGAAPWQGLRILSFERASPHVSEPLTEALSMVGPTGAIGMDFVPQVINWYLPGRTVAMPADLTEKTTLNSASPLWSRQILPDWHLRFLFKDGNWACGNGCDWRFTPVVDGAFRITSLATGASAHMCVVKEWPSFAVANSTMEEYIDPRIGGMKIDKLILSRRCP